jgi:hypothetical protein
MPPLHMLSWTANKRPRIPIRRKGVFKQTRASMRGPGILTRLASRVFHFPGILCPFRTQAGRRIVDRGTRPVMIDRDRPFRC